MTSIISESFLARLQEQAAPLAAVDPYLRWGADAYLILWELTDTDELLEGAVLAFEPGVGPVPSREAFAEAPGPLRDYLALAAHTIPERQRNEFYEGAIPGDEAVDPAFRVYVCIRRVVDFLEEHHEDGSVAPRPAGVVTAAVGSYATAWVDAANLDLVDVGGWLVGHDLSGEIQHAITSITAAQLSFADLMEEHGVGRAEDLTGSVAEAAALLLLQEADALASPALRLIVTANEREGIRERAEGAFETLDEIGRARIGFALDSLARTTESLGTLSVKRCRDLRTAILSADTGVTGGRLVAAAVDAAAALTRRVVDEAAAIRDAVYVNDQIDLGDTFELARDASRRAAVLSRRGQPTRRSWVQAERRWETLDPTAAAVCAAEAERAASGQAPPILTFDAALAVTKQA